MMTRGRCRSVITARRSNIDRSRRRGRSHINRCGSHHDRSRSGDNRRGDDRCGDDRRGDDRCGDDRSRSYNRGVSTQNGKTDQRVCHDVNNCCCTVKVFASAVMVVGTGTHGACYEDAHCQRAHNFCCFCFHKPHPFLLFLMYSFNRSFLTYTTFNECQMKILFENQKK